MKLCKDCSYAKDSTAYPGDSRFTVCTHPKAQIHTGKAKPEYFVDGIFRDSEAGWRTVAGLQRNSGFFDMLLMGVCGKRARWFKAKEEASK